MKKFLFIALNLALLTSCYAQSITSISDRCPSPNRGLFASVNTYNIGSVVVTPCPTSATIFNGAVDFSNATITGIISGSGSVNFVPRFATSSSLTNTPLSWDGVTYNFRNATLTNTFLFQLSPDSPNALFTVGSNTSALSVDQAAQNVSVNATTFNLTGTGNLTFNSTTGGTGSQVINTPEGTVIFGAAASDLTVTSSIATATSRIFCTVQTLDTTAVSCRVTDKAAGSFHIRVPATTAPTTVAFMVHN